MHDPTLPRFTPGPMYPGLQEWIDHALAGVRTQLEPPPPDPAIAHQRARYRLNRAQRRAADRQEQP